MSNTGTDELPRGDRSQESELLSPAALAERVAMLSVEGADVRGGDLPMWDRLPASQQRSWARRLFSGTVVGLSWCGVLGLLAVAASRLFWHDGNVPLTWLNAFTLYLYLPAYLVLALAAWTGRWWLATASAAVVAFHLAWVVPDFQPATPYVPPTANPVAEPESLRIFYANVLGSNTEFDAMLNEAKSSDPDVIALTELHRPWVRYLLSSEVLKAYPYGTNIQKRHYGDTNVFSRLPVSRQRVIYVAGRVVVVIDIPLGAQTVRLYLVHSPRPMFESMVEYVDFWKQMEPLLNTERGPVVVIGDFNATQHSEAYRRLTAGRLRSAHVDRGRGYATTWPNWKLPVPPIRIDQALLSPEVECISIVEGVGRGSDHKPLLLDVRVHSSVPAAAKK
jgi:endonuclease/exonuclease/phosphatase (EEP) superfamily protein YafD